MHDEPRGTGVCRDAAVRRLVAVLTLAVGLTMNLDAKSSTKNSDDCVVFCGDVPYGEADGQSLLLDVFRPGTMCFSDRQTSIAPAIVFVHGGGWSGGNKGDFMRDAMYFARHGYVCFSVGYRLVKDGRNVYPAPLDDVQRAVRWVRAHAAEYGVDVDRIGACGASAGGHLVSLLGTRDTRDTATTHFAEYPSRVTCVVDIFGPADLTKPFPTNAFFGVNVQSLVDDLLGKSAKDAPELAREVSPMYHIDGKTVPFLIIHGTEDGLVPIDQSRTFQKALVAAGVESELFELPGENHNYMGARYQEVLAKMLAFFDRHLK